MKIMDKKSHRLDRREAPNSSPIECECGEHFLWERGRGDRVVCPTCKTAATLDFSVKPSLPEPAKPGED